MKLTGTVDERMSLNYWIQKILIATTDLMQKQYQILIEIQ
jgi:hypothetical protein